jgi:hypothetical protein
MEEFLKQWLLPLFSAGGIGYTAINIWANRKKNNADTGKTKAEGDGQTVKNALQMENLAFDRYKQTEEKLQMVEKLLAEIKLEREKDRQYILLLQNHIREMGGTPPDRPELEG